MSPPSPISTPSPAHLLLEQLDLAARREASSGSSGSASASASASAAEVCSLLRRNLAGNGERRSAAAAAEALEGRLKERRARYLRTKVAWMAAESLVTSSWVDKREAEAEEEDGGRYSSEEEKSLRRLVDAFTSVELTRHADLPSSKGKDGTEPASVLGLPPSHWSESTPSLLRPGDVAVAQRKVEEGLFAQAGRMLEMLEAPRKKRNGDLTEDEDAGGAVGEFSRLVCLPDMIRAEVGAAVEMDRVSKAALVGVKAEERHMDNMTLSVDCSRALVVDHVGVGGACSRSEEAAAEYLITKCKTLLLKLKCLEKEILSATYGRPETVQALRKIGSRLEAKWEAAREDERRTVSHLSQYESAGAEDLKEVSAAYVKLRKEIEGKKWALKELEESAGAK